jgi:hypothetical protein
MLHAVVVIVFRRPFPFQTSRAPSSPYTVLTNSAAAAVFAVSPLTAVMTGTLAVRGATGLRGRLPLLVSRGSLVFTARITRTARSTRIVVERTAAAATDGTASGGDCTARAFPIKPGVLLPLCLLCPSVVPLPLDVIVVIVVVFVVVVFLVVLVLVLVL